MRHSGTNPAHEVQYLYQGQGALSAKCCYNTMEKTDNLVFKFERRAKEKNGGGTHDRCGWAHCTCLVSLEIGIECYTYTQYKYIKPLNITF